MIVDYILETMEYPKSYDARDFYNYIMDDVFDEFKYIATALDSGNNDDVQKALCKYLDTQGYNPEIKKFVNAFNWLGSYK